jgi:hypothetical protein
VLKENGGQASALNAGFALCEGDVTIFLDADDTLLPGTAAAVATAFAADPALVKAQFRTEVIDAEGRPIGRTKPAPHLSMPAGDVRAAELANPFDLVWMATSANAFRRDALARLMPIPEQPFRLCADWYLVHVAALLGPVASLPEIGGGYRLHSGNSYEPQAAELDLNHLRTTIGFSASTAAALLEVAKRLGLSHPDRILSLADLANRMISLRIEPARHPVATDSATSLLADAVRAARRRTGVSAAMKATFVAWFAAMAIAPRPLARRLAVLFLYPQRRSRLSRLLGRWQRGGAETPTAC